MGSLPAQNKPEALLLAPQAGAALHAYLHKLVRPCSLCGCLARCQLCAKCQKVRYCGRACQSRDWASHKAACHASPAVP